MIMLEQANCENYGFVKFYSSSPRAAPLEKKWFKVIGLFFNYNPTKVQRQLSKLGTAADQEKILS